MDDTILKYYLVAGAALAGATVIGLFLVVLRLILFVDSEIIIMGISMSGA